MKMTDMSVVFVMIALTFSAVMICLHDKTCILYNIVEYVSKKLRHMKEQKQTNKTKPPEIFIRLQQEVKLCTKRTMLQKLYKKD